MPADKSKYDNHYTVILKNLGKLKYFIKCGMWLSIDSRLKKEKPTWFGKSIKTILILYYRIIP